jgi:hypothetical protein
MFLVILFVFGTIRMILSLNAYLPLCMDSLTTISAKKNWDAMDSFRVPYNDLWVCIENFNAITSPDDKLRGRLFDSYSSNPFSDFMDEFGMIDLGFSGNPLTLSNHRQGSSLIKERLDRGHANSN